MNIENITDIESKFWLKAKSPFLFLSAAFEFKNYLNNPENFISHLPIYIDATCNGLQHLSAMMNDLSLGKYVNIFKSSYNDIPKDIYSEMVLKVKNDITELIKSDKSFIKLEQLNIIRSFVKRSIMTIPYGVTIKGISEQLISDHFVLSPKSKELKKRVYHIVDSEICNQYILFSYKDIFNLAKIMHNVLYKSYPSLTKLVDYLKNINKFIHQLNLNIPVI